VNAESSSKFGWPSDMKTGSDLIGDATLRYHELVVNSKMVDFLGRAFLFRFLKPRTSKILGKRKHQRQSKSQQKSRWS
jgi:hypothetical protein